MDRKTKEQIRAEIGKCYDQLIKPQINFDKPPPTLQSIRDTVSRVTVLTKELEHVELATMRIVVSNMATYLSVIPVKTYTGNWITSWLYPRWLKAMRQQDYDARYGFQRLPTMFIVHPHAPPADNFGQPLLRQFASPYIIVHPALESQLRVALYEQLFDQVAEWLAQGSAKHHGK